MNNPIKYTRLTDNNFQQEVIESALPTLVVFETDWCGACHIIAPILDRLAIDYNQKIKIGKFNFDDNKLIPHLFRVYRIPTLLFFKNGHLVDLIIGAVSKKRLEGWLSLLLRTDCDWENRISKIQDPLSSIKKQITNK